MAATLWWLALRYYNCAPHFRLVAGEDPGLDTPRNAYFTRANAYGSVLSGGLAGHMYGSGGWAGHHWPDTAENSSTKLSSGLFVWQALACEASSQLQYLSQFVLSGGTKYWELRPASSLLRPQNSSAVLPDNLVRFDCLLPSTHDARTRRCLCMQQVLYAPESDSLTWSFHGCRTAVDT